MSKAIKSLRLLTLTLKDFQGGSFTLVANGENIDIFGANASGKTRLDSAFSWLLFDKDSLGRTDFEIKNLDAHGEAEHGLEHSVEGVLEVNNEKITLKKIYQEIWTKKRGSATATFTGHTTSYFIDSVPIQKKDYQNQIARMVGDESAFRLLTSPTAFPALHWQKQRDLLLSVCGDITDVDVIYADSKLAGLPEILGNRKLADHKKIIMARRTEINKELEKIPVRIDEQRRLLPDIAGLDKELLWSEQLRLETAILDAKLRKQGVDTGGAIAALSKTLSGINADIAKLEQDHHAAHMREANSLMQKQTEIEQSLGAEKRQVSTLQFDIKAKENRLNQINTTLGPLREKWIAVDAETFQDTTNDTCAACGQALPAERVQEAREKALAAFNTSKAERLAEINSKGQQYKEEGDRIHNELGDLQNELTIAETEIPRQEVMLHDAVEKRNTLNSLAVNYDVIPGRGALLHKKTETEAAINTAKTGVSYATITIQQEITDLLKTWEDIKGKLERFARQEISEKRIDELKAEEKKLAAEYEKLEAELYLCEQFIKTQVSLLTDKINSRFEITRFKLFQQNINGGIEPCCEIMVNGVSFNAGLNNAARIQAGCDVIRTLQNHFGLRAPIIVDNRESVTKLPTMDCQIISLIVREKDATLRVQPAREAVIA